MPKLITEIDIDQTASSGAWSFNTKRLVSSLLRQIVIKATTATGDTATTFNVTITDWKNNVVYSTDTKATGTLRHELVVPLKDINTIAVSGSSNDEAFTGKLVLEEV